MSYPDYWRIITLNCILNVIMFIFGYSYHGVSLNQILVVVMTRNTFYPLCSFRWQLFIIKFRTEALV
jgi:hypothetical protein